MLLFQKLVDETQMPKPQEYTNTFILTKELFLVGLLGLQNISNPVERPCIYHKVASSRLSRLVAHSRIFRLFIKGKFDPYVL